MSQLDFGLLILDPEAHRRQQRMKDRTCLSCTRTFLSSGPGNRICMKCKDLDTWRSAGLDDYALTGGGF